MLVFSNGYHSDVKRSDYVEVVVLCIYDMRSNRKFWTVTSAVFSKHASYDALVGLDRCFATDAEANDCARELAASFGLKLDAGLVERKRLWFSDLKDVTVQKGK